MRRPLSLTVEALEARDTPARFGTPWPDGEHLTLSFAPAGTPVAGRPADLAALLQRLGPQARLDVLRAFQTWAVHANLNVGLVADDGSAFGAAGATQGDPRFGDIRVGGVALPGDVLAVTAPFNFYDNFSGNVVVNTAAGFGPDGYDLYTALLQEAGHAFGVGNSSDLASAMYEWYRGTRAGLSAGDVAAVQALYGARTPDKFEGDAGNDTRGTATRYWDTVTADLTTTTDRDVYRFTAGFLTNRVTVNLRAAGLSLVTARVELLDAAGNVVATAAAADPMRNDVTLSLDNVRAGATYFVRVSSARGDVFGVGSYELEVQQRSLLTAVTGLLDTLLDETGLNDTLFTATSLLSNALAVGPRTEYAGEGRFGSRSDVDYYRITVPPAPGGGPVSLVTTVWGQGGAVLNSWVQVQDAFGRRFAAEVLTADGTTTTIQVRGLAPGGTYFLRIASDTGATGAYRFAADLRADALDVPRTMTGTLTAANPTDGGVLRLPQSSQVHFVVTVTGGPAELVVTAADGTVVARVLAAAGRGRSVDVFLPAGVYRVTVRAVGTAGEVGYVLGVAVVTDPVGVRPTDPTRTPEPTPTDPGDAPPRQTTTNPPSPPPEPTPEPEPVDSSARYSTSTDAGDNTDMMWAWSADDPEATSPT